MNHQGIRRKVFISHYKGDFKEVEGFLKQYDKVFIPYILGANDNDDFINSSNSEYVMTQIRKRYLLETTVTIVLIGKCTHSRRYIDWELKSSLRQGEYTPNGIIGILLPSASGSAHLPPRLSDNWNREDNCYARCYAYPSTSEQLAAWIDDAHSTRGTRAHLIKNSQEMMKYNSKCMVCGKTH